MVQEDLVGLLTQDLNSTDHAISLFNQIPTVSLPYETNAQITVQQLLTSRFTVQDFQSSRIFLTGQENRQMYFLMAIANNVNTFSTVLGLCHH